MTDARASGSLGAADIDAASLIVHASCVAFDGKGILILGPSGSGKSSLALQLMAMGAELVADDKTKVHAVNAEILASSPAAIKGMIEARGVGILMASALKEASIQLIVDLGRKEQDRLPQKQEFSLLGQSIPLLCKVDAAHFPAAILQFIKGGRGA